MPLPSIVMPAGVPDWRVAPHDVTLPTPYATVPFTTGQARLRRTSAGAARQLEAELFVTEAQALLVHDWYEDELLAGVLPFAARTLAPDGTREWWHARFVQPPGWSAVASTSGPRWRVAATLRLEGEASTVAPT